MDITQIAANYGIKTIKNSYVNALGKGEAGQSILNSSGWYIVYDDTLPDPAYRRSVVAHELSHIIIGHLSSRLHSGYNAALPTEREADILAMLILAPACVLCELKINTPEEMAELCNIPVKQAQQYAKYIDCICAPLQKHYSHPFEKILISQFAEFIKKYNGC